MSHCYEYMKSIFLLKKSKLPLILFLIIVGLWFLDIYSVESIVEQNIGMVDVMAYIFGGVTDEYHPYLLYFTFLISFMAIFLFGLKWMEEEVEGYEKMVLIRMDNRAKWWKKYLLNQYQRAGIFSILLIAFVTISASIFWGLDSLFPEWMYFYVVGIFFTGFLVVLGIIELVQKLGRNSTWGGVTYSVMFILKFIHDYGVIPRFLSPLSYVSIRGGEEELFTLSLYLLFNLGMILAVFIIGSLLLVRKKEVPI